VLIHVLLLLVQVLVAEVLKAVVPVKEMLEVPALVLFSYVWDRRQLTGQHGCIVLDEFALPGQRTDCVV